MEGLWQVVNLLWWLCNGKNVA